MIESVGEVVVREIHKNLTEKLYINIKRYNETG